MVRKRPFPVLLTVTLALACAPSAVTQGEACAEPANEIVAENCLPGHPAIEWDINGYGDPSIQGFGSDISVAQGETIDFKILTDSDDYRLDIYRMGYYGGMGARRVDTIEPSAALPQDQPDCLTEEVTVFDAAGTLVPAEAPLFDCGNWAVSASWQAPLDATSGIYFARLVREDPVEGERWRNDQFSPSPLPPTAEDDPLWEEYAAVMANPLREPRASHIYFVVRDDDGRSEMLFQTSDVTWQAYNLVRGPQRVWTAQPTEASPPRRPAPRP